MELLMTVGILLRTKPMLIRATKPTIVPAALDEYFFAAKYTKGTAIMGKRNTNSKLNGIFQLHL